MTEIVNKLNEWLVDIDIESLRKHIIKYNDLIAAEAEQIYYMLKKLTKAPNEITGFDFLRDHHKAEINITTIGNVYENDRNLRKVLTEFGNGWQLLGGSYIATKPTRPQAWYVKKNF